MSHPQTTTTPTVLDAAIVSTVLHHICPPSSFSPLPAHLLSDPLRQRHHFVPPSSPADYLSWPSETSQQAISLLEALDPFKLCELPAYSVHYSADIQSLYAHVRIMPELPGVRLIFQWHPVHLWQYHNLALMPFPDDSYSSLSDALRIFQSPDDFIQIPHSPQLEADEEVYWNSYSQGDVLHHSTHPVTKDAPDNSEDAYWAQYSSIQGSGDSTLPSPKPGARKLLAADVDLTNPDERIVMAYGGIHPSQEIYNPLQPPSPTSLSRRLSEISTRPGSPPLLDDSADSASETASPHLPLQPNSASSIGVGTLGADSGIDVALKNTLKGVHQLWQATRTGLNVDHTDFLSFVCQAIEEPPK